MKSFVVIGGGAAGVFGAIRIAELCHQNNLKASITIYESGKKLLRKVKISGGGRCNITHNEFDPKIFAKSYPRGHKELISPFHQFHTGDLLAWFADRDVNIIAEEDGRMFPESHSSQTIIDTFIGEIKKHGIRVEFNKTLKSLKSLKSLESLENQIQLGFEQGDPVLADAVLFSTGSVKTSYSIVESLGHNITELAPSLFTFKIDHPILNDLAGNSFNNISLKLCADKKVFQQTGPMLITHWGLSGPAVLKLSAWAAREMKRSRYMADLSINWFGDKKLVEIEEEVKDFMVKKTQIKNEYPHILTQRFWLNLLNYLEISVDTPWNQLSKKSFIKICELLYKTDVKISGQSRFKEEFVECGGIDKLEINFKTMESKIIPHLYFAGEVVDIDGITGGFNFQNAWSCSWIAGTNIVNSHLES